MLAQGEIHYNGFMKLKHIFLFLALTLAAALYLARHKPVSYGPGAVAPEEPLQGSTQEQPFSFKGFLIKPLATFSLSARVLSREHYRHDSGSALSPWDLALGWGPMSDEQYLKDIEISQHGRFYFWSVQQFPLPREVIETHSANMHMIPADEGVEDVLDGIRVGEVIHLEGILIRAEGPNGWYWQSSLTRADTGAGACEVIFVRRARVASHPGP